MDVKTGTVVFVGYEGGALMCCCFDILHILDVQECLDDLRLKMKEDYKSPEGKIHYKKANLNVAHLRMLQMHAIRHETLKKN